MGMERVIMFPNAGPTWPAVRDSIAAAGAQVQMRMIDNMPSFPDEEPEEHWQELRVSLGGGMITLRREPGRMRVIVWGNADGDLRGDQELLAQACAAAGGGMVG